MKKKIGITVGALALIVVLYFVLRNRIGENSQDYKS